MILIGMLHAWVRKTGMRNEMIEKTRKNEIDMNTTRESETSQYHNVNVATNRKSEQGNGGDHGGSNRFCESEPY